MNELNKIILSILSQENQTGYGIAKALSSTTKHSHQQVYRQLHHLESNGYISSVKVPQAGKPDRIVYLIKMEGQDCTVSNNKEQIELDEFNRDKLQLAIMASMDDESMIENLKDYRYRQNLESIKLEGKEEAFFVYRKLMIDAQLKFVDALIDSLVN